MLKFLCDKLKKLSLYVLKIRLFFIEMNYVIAHVSLVYKHFTLCWNENILLGMFPYFMNISILFNQYCYNIVPHVGGNVCLWFYHVKPRFRVSACITSSNSGKAYCAKKIIISLNCFNWNIALLNSFRVI